MSTTDQDQLFDALNATMSGDRLATYLTAAGFDKARALELYLWNVRMGEAFHLPMQAVEVALRNRINVALVAHFGDHWWAAKGFQGLANEQCKADISAAIRRLNNRNIHVSNGQMVATLSFGFWTSALRPRWNTVWFARFTTAFPDAPLGARNRGLAAQSQMVNDLRNRIWHHEPIIGRNISADYQNMLLLLRSICPVKEQWVRERCKVPVVLRDKPKSVRAQKAGKS